MQSWTLLSLLNWTTDYFQKNNIASARLEAEVLLSHLLQLKRLALYLNFERPMSSDELTRFKALIQRRVKGEPTAYLTGEKEFWSRSFKVGPGVLIPRPETELIVEQTISSPCVALAKQGGKSLKILDIGTGSGILAVTLAKEFPASHVTALDISPQALKYAAANAERHEVGNRIQFLEMDIFKPDIFKTSFDLIVSNPPYIATKVIETLEDNVKNFEPKLALDGDTDGLKFYRYFSEQSHHWLKPNGLLVMEIGEDQGLSVPALFSQKNWNEVKFIKDYSGKDRVVVVKRGVH